MRFDLLAWPQLFSILFFPVVEWLWPSICDMFSPWLFPYFTQNMPNLPANWIRQFNTPILMPWSELYSHYVQMLLNSFIGSIQFLLDTFPACDLILGNIFYWYETYYGNVAVPRHVILPTNSALMLLPWNRLKPTALHINGFYRLLQQVRCLPRTKISNYKFALTFSIYPIAIHSLVTYFYASPGHLGYILTSINGIFQRGRAFYQLYF